MIVAVPVVVVPLWSLLTVGSPYQLANRIKFMGTYKFLLVTEPLLQDDWIEPDWSQTLLAGAVPVSLPPTLQSVGSRRDRDDSFLSPVAGPIAVSHGLMVPWGVVCGFGRCTLAHPTSVSTRPVPSRTSTFGTFLTPKT